MLVTSVFVLSVLLRRKKRTRAEFITRTFSFCVCLKRFGMDPKSKHKGESGHSSTTKSVRTIMQDFSNDSDSICHFE